MREVVARGRSVSVPECVSELSPEQYVYYCRLSFAMAAGVLSVEDFRVRWLSFLIGMGKADFTVLRREYVEQLEAQLSVVDGYLVRDGDSVRLDFRTERNMLPEYRHYRGPGDMLHGLTFGEFVECCTVAECLDLDDLEASMEAYRHIARVLYHIPESEPVPQVLTFHAPMFFCNVWGAVQREPQLVNGRRIDFRIIFRKGPDSKPPDGTGWSGIIFEIASAGLFGDVSGVESADMWAVLLYMYKCKFEYLNEKKQK